jgi:hypothetical protein
MRNSTADDDVVWYATEALTSEVNKMADDLRVVRAQLIAEAIKRPAGNSFMLRGWAVGIVVAVFALSDKTLPAPYFLVAAIPLVMFYFIDVCFQYEQKQLEMHFDDVARSLGTTGDISTNADAYRPPVWRILFRSVVPAFYGSLLLIVLTAVLLKHLYPPQSNTSTTTTTTTTTTVSTTGPSPAPLAIATAPGGTVTVTTTTATAPGGTTASATTVGGTARSGATTGATAPSNTPASGATVGAKATGSTKPGARSLPGHP